MTCPLVCLSVSHDGQHLQKDWPVWQLQQLHMPRMEPCTPCNTSTATSRLPTGYSSQRLLARMGKMCQSFVEIVQYMSLSGLVWLQLLQLLSFVALQMPQLFKVRCSSCNMTQSKAPRAQRAFNLSMQLSQRHAQPRMEELHG